jgi:hypothetical protein
MDLKDFAMTQKGKHITMVAAVADKTGANDYEMRIAGPPAAIKRIFAKSDFAIEIDPHRKTQNLKKQLIEHTEQRKKTFADLARLEGTHERDLFTKPTVEDPDPDKSVFISLQRTRGEGTLWTLAFPFFLWGGWNIFLYPPPALSLIATVSPATGDQDLFLNMVAGPVVAASAAGGTTPDTVVYPPGPPPPGLFTVRIYGYSTGVGAFSMVVF